MMNSSASQKTDISVIDRSLCLLFIFFSNSYCLASGIFGKFICLPLSSLLHCTWQGHLQIQLGRQ